MPEFDWMRDLDLLKSDFVEMWERISIPPPPIVSKWARLRRALKLISIISHLDGVEMRWGVVGTAKNAEELRQLDKCAFVHSWDVEQIAEKRHEMLFKLIDDEPGCNLNNPMVID